MKLRRNDRAATLYIYSDLIYVSLVAHVQLLMERL